MGEKFDVEQQRLGIFTCSGCPGPRWLRGRGEEWPSPRSVLRWLPLNARRRVQRLDRAVGESGRPGHQKFTPLSLGRFVDRPVCR